MKKRVSLCICALMLTGILSGCGGEEIRANSSSAVSETTTVQQSDTTASSSSSAVSTTQTTPSETSAAAVTSEASETTASEQVPTVSTSAPMQTTGVTSSTQANTTLPAYTDISSRLNAIFSPVYNSGGKYSLKVISLSSNESIDVGNCNTKMISASLIKLYVAGAVYENMDAVKAFESYSGETEHLISNMIAVSDNNACNTLVNRLGGGDENKGMATVNNFCRKHGFYNTQMNRRMLNFNGLENYTSTTDCCNILKSYYNKQLKGSENIIRYMKAQTVRTKIPSGITDGTVVANKTGELANVENDSAIVYSSKGVYIMCAMTQNLSDTAAARNAIAQAAYAVHQHQLQKDG